MIDLLFILFVLILLTLFFTTGIKKGSRRFLASTVAKNNKEDSEQVGNYPQQKIN